MHYFALFCNFTHMSSTAQHDSAQEEGPECRQGDFLEDVAAVTPCSWRMFGLYLDIDNGKLEAVEAKNRGDQHLCFLDVYSIWKKENCKPVTWTTVVEILEKKMLANKSLVCQLRKKYGVP